MTSRTLKRVLPVVAGLALLQGLSCKDSDSVVRIAVEGPAGLPALTTLRASLSNAGTVDTKLYPRTPGGAIALPTSFTVTISHQRTGPLDIALDGLNAQGAAVASGTGSVELPSGGTVSVTITLAAGAALCGNGVVDSGEQCDDGDRFTNGTCDFLCRRRTGAGGAGGASAGSGGAPSGTGTGGHASGGASGGAGTTGSGGAPSTTGTGGHAGSGVTGSGGKAAGGGPGATGTGGVSSSGGSPVVGTGGVTPGTGGVLGSGGVASGGSGSGGRGTGGIVGAGGTVGSGGAAGATATGGVTGTAGTPGTGGATASGGITGAGGGGTACAGELLANGGFEDGSTGWTVTSPNNSPIIYPRGDSGLIALGVTPASGDYLAWLGRDLTGGDDLLTSQPINLSSNASGLLLMGLVRVAGGANSSCLGNCPTVSIEAQNGATAQVLKSWAPADLTTAWSAFSIPLNDGVLANGSTVRLHLALPSGVAFDVFFDSLSLSARFCN